MHKRIVPLAVLFLLLTNAFVFSFSIRSVNAARAPATTPQSPAASAEEVTDLKAINLSGMTIGVHVRSNTSTNAMSRYLPFMQEAGITTVRLEFSNTSIPNLRNLVPAIAHNGIKIIGLLLRTDLAPDNVDAWGSWVHSVVDEFKQDVHVWELWNEPNLDKFFPGNDPVKYTKLLKRGYEEAKNADPTCFTLGGSISTTRDTSLNFLRTIYENDGGNYMDALSYHPYCDSYAPEDTTSTSHPYVYLTRVRNLMNEYGQQDKKIWITEMGWASSDTGETLQAEYLVRALELATDWGWVDTFIIYNWKDTTTTAGTDRGLMRIDESLKPSYYAVKDFIKGHVARAAGPVYVRADGSIDPPTAPISTVDNVTYILTGNITGDADGIIVERDNIVVDGAGFTVGSEFTVEGGYCSSGIRLEGRSNVIIQNANIENFTYGIWLNSSSNNSINGNTITNNWVGIPLLYSANNRIRGNTVANNTYDGINLESSSSNIISGNTMANNYFDGIVFDSCSNNTVCHNNFINNTVQVEDLTPEYANFLDNGCEGNYWSNYNGTDSDNDGVGDIHLPWEGVDNCPLMNVYWNPCDINHDLKVNLTDTSISAEAFGTVSGNAYWNPHADITSLELYIPDGKVDMRDIATAARHFGEHYS